MIYFSLEDLREEFDDKTALKLRDKLYNRCPSITRSVRRKYIIRGKETDRLITVPSFEVDYIIKEAKNAIATAKYNTKVEDWNKILYFALKFKEIKSI